MIPYIAKKIPIHSFGWILCLPSIIINKSTNIGSKLIKLLAKTTSQCLIATRESQKPPNVTIATVNKNLRLYFMLENDASHSESRLKIIPYTNKNTLPKKSLYIVTTIELTSTIIGFIKTTDKDVNNNDKKAKIIPRKVVFLLALSSVSNGNNKNASPDKTRTIPDHISNDGISLRITNPKIPYKMFGAANIIIDKVTGDNLFKEAKNKLSPIAIPKIPLKLTIIKLLELMAKLICKKLINIANIIVPVSAFIAVIAVDWVFSPSFLKSTAPNAHETADISAAKIPDNCVIYFQLN